MCTRTLHLRILDILFAVLLCTPLSILFWSGTWKIMDLYMYPDDPNLSSWISFGYGSVLSTANYFLAALLEKCVTVECALQHVISSRLMIYINAVAYLNYWRGVWNLCDCFFGKELASSLVFFLLSHLLLMGIQASGTCLFQPFSVTIDNREKFYETKPRFNSKISTPFLFICDVIFTQFVIVTLCIQVWRGLWNTLDLLLFPDDHFKSYYSCLAIGVSICTLLLCAEELIARLHAKGRETHWLLGLVIEDGFKFLAVVFGLVLWRGGWGLMRDYVIVAPGECVESWLYHGTGILALLMFNAGSSVSPFGCHMDLEQEEFQWPMHFCSSLAHTETAQRLHIQDDDDGSSHASERDPLLGSPSA